MAADDQRTIGDRLPETFLPDLEEAAAGYLSKAALDRPTARGTPAEELADLTEEWSPEAADRIDRCTAELKELLDEIAEEPGAAKAFVDAELGD